MKMTTKITPKRPKESSNHAKMTSLRMPNEQKSGDEHNTTTHRSNCYKSFVFSASGVPKQLYSASDELPITCVGLVVRHTALCYIHFMCYKFAVEITP